VAEIRKIESQVYPTAPRKRLSAGHFLTVGGKEWADLFTPLLRVDPGSAVRTSPKA
jgi:hypothetical protein